MSDPPQSFLKLLCQIISQITKDVELSHSINNMYLDNKQTSSNLHEFLKNVLKDIPLESWLCLLEEAKENCSEAGYRWLTTMVSQDDMLSNKIGEAYFCTGECKWGYNCPLSDSHTTN